MAAVKQVTQDFKDYVEELEKQDLLALLHDLVDNDDVSLEAMYATLKRNKVVGYS